MSDRLQDAVSGAGPKKGFGDWIAGRANRKEYWLWLGPILAVLFVAGFMGIPGVELVVALPMWFAWIRRLHDLGRTGWWALVINFAIAIIAGARDGDHGPGGRRRRRAGPCRLRRVDRARVYPRPGRDQPVRPAAG